MNDRLAGGCANELERRVRLWFEATRELPGAKNFFEAPTVEIPFIGGTFIAGWDPPILLLQVCRALVVREQFHQEKPAWAPDLPLRWEDIEALEHDDSNRVCLVGHYAGSLRLEGWDPRHPTFAPFCSAVLADPATPEELRTDPSLLQEFPPHPLEGICGGWLGWRSPEMLAADRQNAAGLMGA
jgi:hypothetical protein